MRSSLNLSLVVWDTTDPDSKFAMERGSGEEKKKSFALKQGKMQTENFQFQYLLVIKRYFADFSKY